MTTETTRQQSERIAVMPVWKLQLGTDAFWQYAVSKSSSEVITDLHQTQLTEGAYRRDFEGRKVGQHGILVCLQIMYLMQFKILGNQLPFDTAKENGSNIVQHSSKSEKRGWLE